MNNVNLLVAAIDRDPDDLVCGLALVDALIEERDCTRSEAERYMSAVVQSARDARDMATAAALIRPGAPYREQLLDLIVINCVEGQPPGDRVIVGPGDTRPQLSADWAMSPADERPWNATIVVGALWVIHQYREYAHLWAPAPPPKKRRRAR